MPRHVNTSDLLLSSSSCNKAINGLVKVAFLCSNFRMQAVDEHARFLYVYRAYANK